jgi:WD40 repeat protein
MDHSVKVWDAFDTGNCLFNITSHTGEYRLSVCDGSADRCHGIAAVRDAQWNHDGSRIVSAGFDRTARLVDAATGICLHTFTADAFVTALRWHPQQRAVFAAGLAADGARLYDLRAQRVAAAYKGMYGQVCAVVVPCSTLRGSCL